MSASNLAAQAIVCCVGLLFSLGLFGNSDNKTFEVLQKQILGVVLEDNSPNDTGLYFTLEYHDSSESPIIFETVDETEEDSSQNEKKTTSDDQFFGFSHLDLRDLFPELDHFPSSLEINKAVAVHLPYYLLYRNFRYFIV